MSYRKQYTLERSPKHHSGHFVAVACGNSAGVYDKLYRDAAIMEPASPDSISGEARVLVAYARHDWRENHSYSSPHALKYRECGTCYYDGTWFRQGNVRTMFLEVMARHMFATRM